MKKKKGKRKISILKVMIVFLLIYLLGTSIYKVTTVRIKNIYVIGNSYLSDKYIIEKASLDTYPPFFLTTSNKIKKRPFSVYLYIEENTPLFYSSTLNKTVLKDKTNIDDVLDVPLLKNYIPDNIYDDFIDKMSNTTVINRIAEIEYKPNDVDSKRFYLLMNDGNSVYLTLDDFFKINNYVDALKTLNGKKGILYWDSGNYFEVKE